MSLKGSLIIDPVRPGSQRNETASVANEQRRREGCTRHPSEVPRGREVCPRRSAKKHVALLCATKEKLKGRESEMRFISTTA